jgi:hypothetical protein
MAPLGAEARLDAGPDRPKVEIGVQGVSLVRSRLRSQSRQDQALIGASKVKIKKKFSQS